MTKAQREANRLIGARVERVDLRPFEAQPDSGKVRPDRWAFSPRIEFDNGLTLQFSTQETETGEYGTKLCISGKRRKAKAQ